MKVKVVSRILEANDRIAEQNRMRFREAGVYVITGDTKVVERGRLMCEIPSLDEIREYRRRQTDGLPEEFKDLTSVAEPPVRLSTKLSELCEKLYHGII